MVLLNACGQTEATDGEQYTLVAGHQLAGDTPFDEGIKRFADLTEQMTDGRVTVQTHSSGAVGSEAEMALRRPERRGRDR